VSVSFDGGFEIHISALFQTLHVLRASGHTSELRGGRLLRNMVVIVVVALSFAIDSPKG
jgi:hypothetical protein